MKKKLEELNRLTIEEYKQVDKLDVVIVADNLRSALNVGSLFRSTDCFSMKQLFLCGLTPKPPHKEITKSAIGATHSVEWTYFTQTLDAIKVLKEDGYELIGIEQTTDAHSFHKHLFSSKTAIVMGNEVNGISEEVLPLIDQFLEIEQFGTKHSLNVAVCAGIVLFEINKQLRYK